MEDVSTCKVNYHFLHCGSLRLFGYFQLS